MLSYKFNKGDDDEYDDMDGFIEPTNKKKFEDDDY